MKKIFSILIIIALILISSCIDRDILDNKPGVILPPISNLTIENSGINDLKAKWIIPTNIPEEIEQPISVNVQIKRNGNQFLNLTLSNAPTEYIFLKPTDDAKYSLTVKLRGFTKVKDKNYSSNIYSLGQTVYFSK